MKSYHLICCGDVKNVTLLKKNLLHDTLNKVVYVEVVIGTYSKIESCFALK